MNALAGSDVLVADQPFATLDPTTRRAALPGGAMILLSDTVGFVNKLPPTLVAAFRATLEELADADLLIHVADVTHANLHEHMRVVDETLKALELSGRPRLLVLNQADRLRGEEGEALREALGAEFPAAVFASALKGEGLDPLRVRLGEAASASWKPVKTTLPYHAGALVQQIRTRGSLKSVDYEEAGIRIEATVPPELAAEIKAAVRRR
jgi:GTP-binding protein HflX